MKYRLRELSPKQEQLLMWVYATNNRHTKAPTTPDMEYLRPSHVTWQTWSRIEHMGRLVKSCDCQPGRVHLTRHGEDMVAEILAAGYPPRNNEN